MYQVRKFTDMQLLVPPLEDRGGDFGSKTGDVSTSNSSKSRSVMSQGLQDKFEAMEQTWNQSRTSSSTTRSETAAASSSLSETAAASAETNQGEDSSSSSSHQKKKRKLAIETAFAIESEVQKWQRGIAELEAMLEEANGEMQVDAQGSSSSSSSSSFGGEAPGARPPEIVRFPSLPPIIPAEEGDLEGSRSSNAIDEEGSDEEEEE